ncbi:hypothetical protein NC652_021175 [Populus alba x Populus x berolinensis]|nr:hypothetical protein NC652_021175 [Populus alba x Populus x berolinensis]
MVKGDKTYLFENLFPKRNTPSGIAINSFITAAAAHQPLGFGTTGEGNLWGRRELLLSLGMLAAKPHQGN